MPETNPRDDFNRDDEMKPDRPPRSAYEPEGSEGSERTPKTLTDPASGKPLRDRHEPQRSDTEDSRGS